MKRSTIAVNPSRRGLTVAALSFLLALASPMGVTAGEAEAKSHEGRQHNSNAP